jgi:hypothetical protein
LDATARGSIDEFRSPAEEGEVAAIIRFVIDIKAMLEIFPVLDEM